MARVSAYGDITITDLTDVGRITSYLTSSLPLTVLYNPNQTPSYNPNWETTNLVLTPTIFFNDTLLSLTASGLTITWQRQAGSGSVTNLVSGESPSNGKLIVSKNVLEATPIITYVNDKFIVNNDGIATLQGATVVGNITAESGKIGKFNLDNLALVTGDTDVTCAGLGGSSQAFWAGSLTMDDAPFRVGYDGSFYSSKGKIAGWEITSDSFYKDTDDYTVYVCPGTNNNKDFLTVHDKNKSSGDEWPFYVHADGWMHCIYGDIGGWNIGKNSINSSYSNTETTEYYVSDSFYSLSILSDSSKIISEFNEKKYSDSSKQKILSSESDSLTISGDSIQGTSRYILYGEETDKSGYNFLLSAYNGLEILDEVSEEGISYT